MAAARGERTLLVDLDPQANASQYVLGPVAAEAKANLLDLFKEGLSFRLFKTHPRLFVHPSPFPKLDLVPSHPSVDGILSKLESRHKIFRIREVVDALGYGTVFFDTPALAHRAPQLEAATADRIVGRLRGSIGGAILRKWRFPEELVVCATEGEHWLRDPGPEPDYCDVVVVAQLLGLLGSASQLDGLPNISEVPAFGKLRLAGAGGEDAADAGSAFLEERREQISHTERLLAS